MEDRKTKEITTASGKVVVLKEYITAGEFLDISESQGGSEPSKGELAKQLVSLAVVSIDGQTDDIQNRLRALPLPDYLAISKEVTKIVNGDFTEAKTQAQS